jgi:hypothetical protein
MTNKFFRESVEKPVSAPSASLSQQIPFSRLKILGYFPPLCASRFLNHLVARNVTGNQSVSRELMNFNRNSNETMVTKSFISHFIISRYTYDI